MIANPSLLTRGPVSTPESAGSFVAHYWWIWAIVWVGGLLVLMVSRVLDD